MSGIPTHQPGQMEAFPTALSVSGGPLTLEVKATLVRTPRQKCHLCGNRRICFSIAAGDLSSLPMCAKCAGIR